MLDGDVTQWLPDVDDIAETAGDDRPLYPDWLRHEITATKPYTGERHFPGWPDRIDMTLTRLAASLYDHGDSITSVAAHQMEIDIRLAARACSNLATLRFRIAEIAEQALMQDPGATKRDLIDALADAEF